MTAQQLTSQHHEAIALLIEGKSQTEVAEELGIHRNTVGNWVRDNVAFDKAYKDAIRRITHRRMPELMNAMMETAISEGSAAMAKLILEANGMLTQKHEVSATTSENGPVDIDKMKARVAAWRSESNE